MAALTATILIPDISGFTEFMTTTELEHGSHIISSFLETIVKSADENFEVSEIEGDAVLFYKKGGPISKKELLDQCLKIFNAFHYQRKMIQQLTVCPCGVCQSMINLSLKFIAHFGTISEIKVNRFTKASGLDMIIAHRLLKNKIPSNEYVLITKSLLNQPNNNDEPVGLNWQMATEEFPAIGKVEFNYAILENVKQNIPDPPKPNTHYTVDDDSPYIETEIQANFKDVYAIVSDMNMRVHWIEGLRNVELGEASGPYIGSIQHFVFDHFKVIVSPLSLKMSDKEIIYAETWNDEEINLSAVCEFRFRHVDITDCHLVNRVLAAVDKVLVPEVKTLLMQKLLASSENLKTYCENIINAGYAVTDIENGFS